jgi:hypothetical protein
MVSTTVLPCCVGATSLCIRASGYVAAHVATHTACSRLAPAAPRGSKRHAAVLSALPACLVCVIPPHVPHLPPPVQDAPRAPAPPPSHPRSASAHVPHLTPLRAPQRAGAHVLTAARGAVCLLPQRHATRHAHPAHLALHGAAVSSTASTAARARHSPATRQRPAARASTGPSPPPWRFCLCACGRRAVWRAPALHCAPAHDPPARPRSRTPCPAPRASVLLVASL